MITFMMLNGFTLPFPQDSELQYIERIKNEQIDFSQIKSNTGNLMSTKFR